jgi:hypothetical protein
MKTWKKPAVGFGAFDKRPCSEIHPFILLNGWEKH